MIFDLAKGLDCNFLSDIDIIINHVTIYCNRVLITKYKNPRANNEYFLDCFKDDMLVSKSLIDNSQLLLIYTCQNIEEFPYAIYFKIIDKDLYLSKGQEVITA